MKKLSLNRLKLRLPIVILIIGLTIFLYIKLSVHRYYYDDFVDQRLRSAANATALIIQDPLIEKAQTEEQVNILEYDSLQKLANQIAIDNRVVYVYVMISRNDSAFFVLSSYNKEDISNDLVTRYNDCYFDVTDKMMSAFNSDKEEIFDVTIDVWGHFRSLYLPMKTKAGTPYLLCADVRSNEIVRQQWYYIIEMLLSFVFIFLVTLPLIFRIRKIILANKESI